MQAKRFSRYLKRKTSDSELSPMEWAKKYNVLKNVRTPFLRGILNSLSSDHPIKTAILNKGAAIGLSTGIIPDAMGYILDNSTQYREWERRYVIDEYNAKISDDVTDKGPVMPELMPMLIERRKSIDRKL